MSETVNIQHKSKKMTILVMLCGLFFAGMVVLGALLFARNKGELSAHAKSESVIHKVEKLYLTPSGEVPTVAEIKDKNSLPKDQEFYKDARNGDYLLVYRMAKIAILYRESINKLVTVSPVIPAANSAPSQ